MSKLLIFYAFTLLSREWTLNNVANYTLLRCKILAWKSGSVERIMCDSSKIHFLVIFLDTLYTPPIPYSKIIRLAILVSQARRKWGDQSPLVGHIQQNAQENAQNLCRNRKQQQVLWCFVRFTVSGFGEIVQNSALLLQKNYLLVRKKSTTWVVWLYVRNDLEFCPKTDVSFLSLPVDCK